MSPAVWFFFIFLGLSPIYTYHGILPGIGNPNLRKNRVINGFLIFCLNILSWHKKVAQLERAPYMEHTSIWHPDFEFRSDMVTGLVTGLCALSVLRPAYKLSSLRYLCFSVFLLRQDLCSFNQRKMANIISPIPLLLLFTYCKNNTEIWILHSRFNNLYGAFDWTLHPLWKRFRSLLVQVQLHRTLLCH